MYAGGRRLECIDYFVIQRLNRRLVMNMSVWNPFHGMKNMLERYTHAAGRGLGNSKGTGINLAEWSPPVDIKVH